LRRRKRKRETGKQEKKGNEIKKLNEKGVKRRNRGLFIFRFLLYTEEINPSSFAVCMCAL
jgi:hypothetical protein